jgi:hypothetical protein
VLAADLLWTTQLCRGGIVLTSISPAYSQDFNTLASGGTSSVVPASWAFSEAEAGADATYTADDGGSPTADTYSYGLSGSSDRAFGTLRSGLSLFFSTIGAEFTTGDTAAIESLTMSYRGEQWRLGTTDRTDQLDFQYSLSATGVTTGSWTDVDALDFVTPNTIGPTVLDGNSAGNFTTISSTISNLSIAPSASFWIRWKDFNAIGADDGLAVDDFHIVAAFAAVPEPGAVLFGGLMCAAIGTVLGLRLVYRSIRFGPT